MKKTLFRLGVGVVVIAFGAVAMLHATDRLFVRNIDGTTNAPLATAAVSVALTPAATGTNTVTGLTATAATITVYTGLAPTVTPLTKSITYVGIDGSTNTLAVVTNVTISAAAPVTNVTCSAVAAVTNANVVSTGNYGFTKAQANGILTNANLFYQLLQSNK